MQSGILLQSLHAGNAASAGFAYVLILKLGQRLGRIAEHAGGLVLLQDDAIILGEDLQFIPFSNVQNSAQLDGQYDSSQFIHFTNDSSRFHRIIRPFLSL